MSKYADIIDLLDKSTGPSRWLDARIDAALRVGTEKMRAGGYEWAWDNFPVWCRHMQSAGMCGVMHTNGDLGLIWDSERFTASVDAALALVEKHFPGKVWYVRGHANGDFFCQMFTHEVQRGLDPKGTAPTAPLAILLSFFRALEAKENAG